MEASILALAASHAAKKLDDCRDSVTPGTYKDVRVTVTAEVGGKVATALITAPELVVGEDESYTPTTSIPQLATLALALKKAGFMREQIKAILVEACTEALQKGEKCSEAIELQEDLTAAMDTVRATMAALPKQTRKGKVSLKKPAATGFVVVK